MGEDEGEGPGDSLQRGERMMAKLALSPSSLMTVGVQLKPSGRLGSRKLLRVTVTVQQSCSHKSQEYLSTK